jgi:hypothetical protein
MKIAITLFVVICAVLASGCMATAPSDIAPASAFAPVPTNDILPDLTGMWTGPMQGYDEKLGYTDYPGLGIALNVTEQHGRFFSGHIQFTWNGTVDTTPIAGVISRDGTTFTMVEKGNGFSNGVVLGKDEIELTYLYDVEPYSVSVDTLKRV